MKPRIKLGPAIGAGREAIIQSDDGIETGILLPSQEGKPIPEGSDLLAIEAREDEQGWSNFETLFTSRCPAQVATRAYCDGYERIFGHRKVGVA